MQAPCGAPGGRTMPGRTASLGSWRSATTAVTGKPGEAPLDPWSIVHFGSGLAVGLVLRSPVAALAALVLYEGFEGLLRRVKRQGGKGLFEHESWANITYDVLFGMMG